MLCVRLSINFYHFSNTRQAKFNEIASSPRVITQRWQNVYIFRRIRRTWNRKSKHIRWSLFGDQSTIPRLRVAYDRFSNRRSRRSQTRRTFWLKIAAKSLTSRRVLLTFGVLTSSNRNPRGHSLGLFKWKVSFDLLGNVTCYRNRTCNNRTQRLFPLIPLTRQ